MLIKSMVIFMKLIITDTESFDIPISGECMIIKPDGKIHTCTGCFGCWLKTPGVCVIHDGYENTGIYVGKCDEMIIISKCVYGSFSPFVKTVIDRSISYNQPDFVIRNGEMHHKPRYDSSISFSVYLYGDDICEKEKETAKSVSAANAVNYNGTVRKVKFYRNIKEIEAEFHENCFD